MARKSPHRAKSSRKGKAEVVRAEVVEVVRAAPPASPQMTGVSVSSHEERHMSAALIDTPQSILSAYMSATNGMMSYAAAIAERMFGDERMGELIDTLVGVLSLPMTFDGGDERVCKALEDNFWAMFPETVQFDLVKWTRVFNTAVAQIKEWVRDPKTGIVNPRIVVWSPRSLRFDTEQRRWMLQTTNGEISITPGDGEWILLYGYSSNKPIISAPWYGLAMMWLAKQFAQNGWSEYSDRLGQGKWVVECAAGNPLTPDQVNDLADRIESLGRNGTIVLPPGLSLLLRESTAKSEQNFSTLIGYCNTAMTISLLGANGNSEMKSGSFAQASVHERTTDDKRKSVAETFGTQIREQVLKYWVAKNFGPKADVPWPRWNVERPADKAARSVALNSVSTVLVNFKTAGIQLTPKLLEALGEEVGLPLVAAPTPVEPTSPSPKPAQPPGKAPTKSVSVSEERASSPSDPQDWVDGLTESAIEDGQKALEPDVEALIEVVRSASSYDDMRKRVIELVGRMDPASLASTVERATILAALAGRHAVMNEV